MRTLILVLILLPTPVMVHAAEHRTLLREDFHDLQNWKPLYFPKIDKHTVYTIESDGTERYLRAESKASASGLIYKKEFNVYEYPLMRWRWKVNSIYQGGDARTKQGDDYPIRVYVLFKYDPEGAGFFRKLTYSSAKLIYGEYPPHSSLNYIWANKQHPERIITNAYAVQAKMILLEKGKRNLGKWLLEEVDVIGDYQTAFGEKPPATASLAIMNDSDNTGEGAVSYIDFIEVYR